MTLDAIRTVAVLARARWQRKACLRRSATKLILRDVRGAISRHCDGHAIRAESNAKSRNRASTFAQNDVVAAARKRQRYPCHRAAPSTATVRIARASFASQILDVEE